MSSASEEEEFQGDEDSEEEFEGDEESEEEELQADEESSDDDEPIAAMKKRKASPKKSMKEDSDDEEEEESSDDSDDDIPLAALKSPPKKKEAKPAPKKKATKVKASKPAAKKAKKKKDASSEASNGKFSRPSAALYGTNCQKGQLIQTLLCRWWYAITWPENIPSEPPKYYDSLDGMPGVFVCTSGESVGKILDMRDMTKCPNFKNFAQKPSSELKDLVIKALNAQKEALIKADGAGTETEKDINRLLKWAEKLNPDKADKEAVKVLKASKLELSS